MEGVTPARKQKLRTLPDTVVNDVGTLEQHPGSVLLLLVLLLKLHYTMSEIK